MKTTLSEMELEGLLPRQRPARDAELGGAQPSGAGITEERGRRLRANCQDRVVVGFLLELLCIDGPRPQRKLPRGSPLAFCSLDDKSFTIPPPLTPCPRPTMQSLLKQHLLLGREEKEHVAGRG